MNFVNLEARKASEELAKERGPFPNWEGSIWQQNGHEPRRNATVTTIAPTGTIAMIADASGGVEPQFALVYWKNVMRDENNKATSLRYLNNIFEKYAQDNGFYGEDLIEAIEANHGSVRIRPDTPEKAQAVLERIPEEARRIFITAHDVTPEAHIRMQAAFQKYTENAVSKTINFPNDAQPDDINEGYWLAYELGCKGVTVYRDGSRAMQVMTTSAEKDDGAAESNNGHTEQAPAGQTNGHIEVAPRSQVAAAPRSRPKTVSGTTSTVDTGCGDLFVTMNDDGDGHPFEVFATLGKAGGCAAAQTEAIGRLISLALRSGVGVERVHKQLRGITCHRPVGLGPNRILSCADAIAHAVSAKYLEDDGSYRPYVDFQGEGTYTEVESANRGFEKSAESSQQQQSASVKVTAVQGSMFQEEFVPVYESTQEQGACANCGSSQMYFSEGCVTCVVCGHSQCS
jgi:ribonucleoside-diphosphate reductase alpha chain